MPDTTLERIRCPAFNRCFRRTDASAPPAESLPAPKNFFAKTSFTQRLPPLSDRTIFGQVFVRGGMIKFSKWKVPPTGGASAPQQAAGSRFFEIRRHRAGPDPLTDELDHVEKPALGRWSCRSLLGLLSSPQHVSGRVARAEPVGLSATRFYCAINLYKLVTRRQG